MTGSTQEDYAAMMLAGGRSVEGNRHGPDPSGKDGASHLFRKELPVGVKIDEPPQIKLPQEFETPGEHRVLQRLSVGVRVERPR